MRFYLSSLLLKLSFANEQNSQTAVLNDELNEHCHQVPGQRSMKCFFSEDEKFSLFCSCGESVCDETWKKTWKRNSQLVEVDTDDITRRLTLKGGSSENGFSELDIFMKHNLQGNYTCLSNPLSGESTFPIMEYHIAVPHLEDTFQIEPRLRESFLYHDSSGHYEDFYTTKVGKEIELECQAPVGEPEPEISWLLSGRPIKNDDNHRFRKLQQKSILTIQSVKLEDSGFYKCEARAQIGTQSFSRFSSKVKIQVESKPKVFDLLICPEKRVNSKTTLSCGFRAEPLPEIYWEKCDKMEEKSNPVRGENGCRKWEGQNNTQSNEKESTTRSSINFRKIKKSDSGLYRCWAINSLGETPSQCVQTVYENIEVVKPLSQTKYEHEDASFSCGGAGAKVNQWEFYPENEDPKIVVFSKREKAKDGIAKIIFEAQSLSDKARRNDRLTSNWSWTRENSMNNLIIRNIGEQNAGKYVCAVVYDGPNEENEHLLEATLTVPSQYEIRSVNVQKYVGISLTESNCNAEKCSIMCSGQNAKEIRWEKPQGSDITEKELKSMISPDLRNDHSQSFSRIDFGFFGPENIHRVLGTWDCHLYPKNNDKANPVTKSVDVYLKSNEKMKRNLMNIELENLKVNDVISFRPSYCPTNSVFLVVHGGEKTTEILDTLYCKKFLRTGKIDTKISQRIAIIPAFEEFSLDGEVLFVTSQNTIRKKQLQPSILQEPQSGGIFNSHLLLIKSTDKFERISAKKLQLAFHTTNTSLLISWEAPNILEMGKYYITGYALEIDINLPNVTDKDGLIELNIPSGKPKIAVNLMKFYSSEDLVRVKEVHVRVRVISRIFQSEAISKSLNILILEEPEKSQTVIGLFIMAMLVAVFAIVTAICTCLYFLRRKKMLSKRDSASLEIAPPETTETGFSDDYAREWDRLNPPSDISVADFSEHSDQKDSHAARIQRQIFQDQDFCQKRPRKRGRKRIRRQTEDDPYEGEDELDEPQAKFVLPQMDPSRHSTYSDQFTVSDHDDEFLHSGRYGNRPVGIVPPYTPPRSYSQPQYIPNYSQEGQKAPRYKTENF